MINDNYEIRYVVRDGICYVYKYYFKTGSYVLIREYPV